MEQHIASASTASPQPASSSAASPHTSPSPASPPPSPLPDDNDRCAYVSRRGRRCRANRTDPLFRLCHKHSAKTAPDPDSGDLTVHLFGALTPTLGSAEEINFVLTNLVILLAQGRISSRRAGVITYALSFILRGVQIIEKKAFESPQEFIVDIPSAVASRAAAFAQTQHLDHDQVLSGNR